MSDHTSSLVRVEQDDARTRLVLDNPQRSNHITLQAMEELIAGLEKAHAADSLTVVIAATGDDFCLGRDQSERPAGVSRLDSLRLILRANELLRSFPGVSVCLVQGRALGFGSGLAVQSDITIAAEDATFGFDEVLHGLAPLVVAAYLPDYVGAKLAAELLFTGRPVPAAEALQLRMINRTVHPSELAGAGAQLLAQLRSLEPGALRLMKRFMQEMRAGSLADPESTAVTWLDDWISAGRPAVP